MRKHGFTYSVKFTDGGETIIENGHELDKLINAAIKAGGIGGPVSGITITVLNPVVPSDRAGLNDRKGNT
jgi:hypothetical protein